MNSNCCPVEKSINVIGGKWKILIIYNLSKSKSIRFNELHRLLKPVTQKMLTTQLRALEKDGIVKRVVFEQIPPKVEYSLTKKGEDLLPIMDLLYFWGEKHCLDQPHLSKSI